jgi:hypothetical protein
VDHVEAKRHARVNVGGHVGREVYRYIVLPRAHKRLQLGLEDLETQILRDFNSPHDNPPE